MRQLQLFTTAQLAKMRDRTAARNYSVESEEFRRNHERHRAWGLERRHAERLRQLREKRRAALEPAGPAPGPPPARSASGPASGSPPGRSSPGPDAGSQSGRPASGRVSGSRPARPASSLDSGPPPRRSASGRVLDRRWRGLLAAWILGRRQGGLPRAGFLDRRWRGLLAAWIPSRRQGGLLRARPLASCRRDLSLVGDPEFLPPPCPVLPVTTGGRSHRRPLARAPHLRPGRPEQKSSRGEGCRFQPDPPHRRHHGLRCHLDPPGRTRLGPIPPRPLPARVSPEPTVQRQNGIRVALAKNGLPARNEAHTLRRFIFRPAQPRSLICAAFAFGRRLMRCRLLGFPRDSSWGSPPPTTRSRGRRRSARNCQAPIPRGASAAGFHTKKRLATADPRWPDARIPASVRSHARVALPHPPARSLSSTLRAPEL